MTDKEGVAPPIQESDSGARTVNQQTVEATVNGVDKSNLSNSKGRAGSKSRNHNQKASNGKANRKSNRRAKAKSRGDSPDHADDSSSTSSSEEDSDSDSDTHSDVGGQKKKKRSRHAGRGKSNRESQGRINPKPSRKTSKSKSKPLNKDLVGGGSTDSSSTSDTESDLSEDGKTAENQEIQHQDGDSLNAISQQQIRDLQLQISMLQQAMMSQPFGNAQQYGFMPAPQANMQPATVLNPPGLFPMRGSSQMSNMPSNQLRSLSIPQGGSTSPTQGNRSGRRGVQHSPNHGNMGLHAGRNRLDDKVQPKNHKQGNPSRPDFKRVDWVWDTTNYTYKLQDSVEADPTSQYDGYVFHVRRIFDPDGKYRKTTIDVKSKLLREALQEVMGNPKGVSLVDETPKLDPNLLFLYLSDFKDLLKSLRKAEPVGKSKKSRRRNRARLDDKKMHLKVLIKYLEADYDKIKSSLDPMLKNGLITFDLLWALWKPDTLAYASTYGNLDMPRVFRMEAAERHATLHKGEYYYLDGKYFEFDGKRFGYGQVFEEIPEFKGARKVTSLPCYPLSYCVNEEEVRQKLIARGQKFVALSGMHYKAYNGMAFMKRKKAIIRFNIANSRIMVDPATFRRTNPNYYVSQVRSRDPDIFGNEDSSEDDEDDDDDDDDDVVKHGETDFSDADAGKLVTRAVRDATGTLRFVQMQKNEGNNKQTLSSLPQEETVNSLAGSADEPREGTINEKDGLKENGSVDSEKKKDDTVATETQLEQGGKLQNDADDSLAEIKSQLTNIDFLLASPVVLGFSFSEKQWLEFSVDSVLDIKWNDKAWDSLVLEAETKRLIRALVESRKYNPATTIDDVIQGKGKGLVAVLHGPPGTGKTLTAEGISELLKCPLYMASAGELGTDSRFLEHELQKILDICHTWGAILLLDEADVFLEKRNMQDIHRNALVSIFLRQLEYFQGILFLTTNRVETFDEAFQSRIHVALRYDKLDLKAKRAIFKLFIDRVKAYGRMEIEDFSESELSALAKQDLNGREIKNVMGSAQDLALNKKEPLGIKHIRQVLDVHAKFGRDLKGGTGFEDAMRSYF